MTDTNNPFQPGAEVAFVNYPRWGGKITMRRGKVAKVYKSGNFTLEGSTQQYKPCNSAGFGWRAYATGKGSWHYDSLEPITPDLLEKIAESDRKADIELLFASLGKQWRKLCTIATDQEIACLSSLLDRAQQVQRHD